MHAGNPSLKPASETMANICQLNPPIPVNTPRGKGLAHLVIDYGPEHNLFWTIFLDATAECWTFSNTEIRARTNITMGRMFSPALGERARSNGHDVELGDVECSKQSDTLHNS